jgi:hypothetical protein
VRQLDHRLHSPPISLSTTLAYKAREEPGHLPRESTRLAVHLQPGGHGTGLPSFHPFRRRSSPARQGDPAFQSAISASGQTRKTSESALCPLPPGGGHAAGTQAGPVCARNGHDLTWSAANPNSKQLKQARAGAYRSRREKQPRKILDPAYLALRKIRKGISGICGAPGARD